MSIGELFGWGSILVAVLVAFVLGAAPVFAVRLIAAIYPKNHPRRRELIAESAHVKRSLLHIGEQWRWLGEMFALAVIDGLPVRWRNFDQGRRKFAWMTYEYYFMVDRQNASGERALTRIHNEAVRTVDYTCDPVYVMATHRTLFRGEVKSTAMSRAKAMQVEQIGYRSPFAARYRNVPESMLPRAGRRRLIRAVPGSETCQRWM